MTHTPRSAALGVGLAVLAVMVVLWGGAELAALVTSGQPFAASPAVVIRSVIGAFARPGSPATAWPAGIASRLPGAVRYPAINTPTLTEVDQT